MITENTLKELLDLMTKSKAIQKRIDEIKGMCREKGSFSTANYVCLVQEQSSRKLVGLDEVAAVVGLSVLENNDLINYSTYDVVRVSRKF